MVEVFFVNDGTQLYIMLQPLYYTLKRLDDTKKVVSWKSKDLSTEKLTAPVTTNNSLSPLIEWYENSNLCSIFKESSLKQKKRNSYSSKTNKLFCCI